jgi:hypothetical protein
MTLLNRRRKVLDVVMVPVDDGEAQRSEDVEPLRGLVYEYKVPTSAHAGDPIIAEIFEPNCEKAILGMEYPVPPPVTV